MLWRPLFPKEQRNRDEAFAGAYWISGFFGERRKFAIACWAEKREKRLGYARIFSPLPSMGAGRPWPVRRRLLASAVLKVFFGRGKKSGKSRGKKRRCRNWNGEFLGL